MRTSVTIARRLAALIMAALGVMMMIWSFVAFSFVATGVRRKEVVLTGTSVSVLVLVPAAGIALLVLGTLLGRDPKPALSPDREGPPPHDGEGRA